jgi:UDP-2,3-diacylglucosamine pyrophosphatase LpxH
MFGCKRFQLTGLWLPPSINVEKRFAQSQEWNNQHSPIVIEMNADDYRFYVGSDVHIEKTTDNLTKLLDISRNNSQNAFLMLLGDLITVRGAFDIFAPALDFNSDTQQFDIQVFTTIGNHDLLYDQWNDYARYFGTATYSFVVKTPNEEDFFIVLDSGSGTLGKSQMQWLKSQLKERGKYRHCTVMTHTNIFRSDSWATSAGSFPLEETYEMLDLFSQNNVDLVITGHDHYYELATFGNVSYLIIDTMRDTEPNPQYLSVEVSDLMAFSANKF